MKAKQEWFTPQRKVGSTAVARASINKLGEDRAQIKLAVPLSTLDTAALAVGDRVAIGVTIRPRGEGLDFVLRESDGGYKISYQKSAGEIIAGRVSIALPCGHPLEKMLGRTMRQTHATGEPGLLALTLK